MEHFGVTVKPSKYGFELNRENYAIINPKNSLHKFSSMKNDYADEEGKYYTEEWCIAHRENCLKNYDISMEFFKSLNHDEFDKEINKFIKKYKKFKEVHNLEDYNNVSGYYLMVLDKYCQMYIGTSTNIKKRIQSHWSKIKSFDRLLFPMGAVETSIISIDSFRALDTTRIYAFHTTKLYDNENQYINFFSPKFLCNRIGGGRIEPGLLGFLQVYLTKKSKNLKTENK